MASLSPAPDRMVGGVLVRSAFEHDGAARLLVHRLKYEAVAGIAARLAVVLGPLVPSGAAVLVPLPRPRLRYWHYGVDPARALATAMGRRSGISVADILAPRLWVRRRAGAAREKRGVPSFACRGEPPAGVVLIDDVITTGTTVAAAAGVVGAHWAVTVTAAAGVGR